MATNTYAEDARKRKLREALMELLKKQNDPKFARYALYREGYDLDAIDGEMQNLQQFQPGYTEPQKQEVVSGSRPLGDVSTRNIGEAKSALSLLDELSSTIDDPKHGDVFAPVRGNVRKYNPYDVEAQSVQAQINSAKQLIGKYLEGGVLRKEDEIKYEKILPKLGDSVKTAQSKIENVRNMITNKTQSELETLGQGDFDVAAISEGFNFGDESMQTKSPDDQAREWLIANPDDPRAEQVKAKLGKTTTENITPAKEDIPKDNELKGFNKLADKVGGFLGIKKFAQGMGTTLFLMTKEGRELQDKAEKGDKFSLQALQDILAEAPTSKEVVGSAALTGLNVASGGLYGKAATTAGKIGMGAAVGGAFGTAGGMEQDEDIDGIIRSAATGATVGGALALAGVGLSKLKDKLSNLSKWASKKTYDSALGLTGSKIEKGASPSGNLIKKGVIGSGQKLQKLAQESRVTIDKEIEKNLSTDIKIKSSDVIGDIVEKTTKEFGGSIDQREIEKVLLSNKMPFKQILEKNEINMKNANSLRKIIDNKFIGNSKWTTQNPDAFTVSVLKNAANTLRENVKASNPNLAGLFEDYATAIKLDTAITSELVRPRRLRNYIDVGMGAGVGVINPVAGAVGFGARKISESTIGKTTAAVGLDRFATKILDKVSGVGAGKITKTTILNWLREMKDEEN